MAENKDIVKPVEIESEPSQEENNSHSGSGSGSDSEFDLKIIEFASKAKGRAQTPIIPAKSSGEKRLMEGKESEAKRSKNNPEPKPETSNVLFQRIWSEEDEIAVLEGLIEFMKKNRSDPVVDLTAFHDYIKDNLHLDATKTQLLYKIRKFRYKYNKNNSKAKAGKDRNFSNAHEKKAYELSKLVWGNDNGGKKSMASIKAHRSPVNNVVAVDKLSAEMIASANGFSMRQMISRVGMELFEGKNKVEGDGESEWRRLKVAEMEAYLKNLEVVCAMTKVVLDALKASNY